jgi:hypothetical protein
MTTMTNDRRLNELLHRQAVMDAALSKPDLDMFQSLVPNKSPQSTALRMLLSIDLQVLRRRAIARPGSSAAERRAELAGIRIVYRERKARLVELEQRLTAALEEFCSAWAIETMPAAGGVQ